VELGALAGALGGGLTAGALYAIARARVRRVTAALRLVDDELERARAQLEQLQRQRETGQASGDAMPPAGEDHP
jgi:hypothetical protein